MADFVTKLLEAVKGLTPANILVFFLLLCTLVPAFIVYKLLTDDQLLDRFLSSYKVLGAQQTNCTVHRARERGGNYAYAINDGFAFEGGLRWSVVVTMGKEPTVEQVASYCEALELLVAYMRDPSVADKPTVIGED